MNGLPIKAVDAAKYFHHYLTDKSYRKNINFNNKRGKEIEQYDERKVASLIQRMPMTMWGGSTKMLTYVLIRTLISQRKIIQLSMKTRQICEYRLHSLRRNPNHLKKCSFVIGFTIAKSSPYRITFGLGFGTFCLPLLFFNFRLMHFNNCFMGSKVYCRNSRKNVHTSFLG